jgi:Lrp/AsnC family leucine-responsive transcriptional regulator
MLKLDRIDRHILELMQENGRISNLELAELVGLSSPCSRRVKALEDAGLIDTHVTLLNARQLGLTLTAYIHISMDRHTPERFENFDRAISDLPEVLSATSSPATMPITSSRWWCGTWSTTSTSCWTS